MEALVKVLYLIATMVLKAYTSNRENNSSGSMENVVKEPFSGCESETSEYAVGDEPNDSAESKGPLLWELWNFQWTVEDLSASLASDLVYCKPTGGVQNSLA